MYRNPVSDAHVAQFFEYVDKWQKLLNLSDWEIANATHTESRDSENRAAIFDIEPKARMARLMIGWDWGIEPVTDESLEETAIHELLHLLLYLPLEAAAEAGDENDESVEGPEHSVIRVLARLLSRSVL